MLGKSRKPHFIGKKGTVKHQLFVKLLWNWQQPDFEYLSLFLTRINSKYYQAVYSFLHLAQWRLTVYYLIVVRNVELLEGNTEPHFPVQDTVKLLYGGTTSGN